MTRSKTLLGHLALCATLGIYATAGFAQPKLPPMQAPPGYTVKQVGEPVMNYSFVGYERAIPMPVAYVSWSQAEAPKGITITDQPYKPSDKLKKVIADPNLLIPGFEAPMRVSYIGAKGKDGGTIMLVEYANVMPPNTRALMNKMFHGKESDPEHTPDPKDEVLVTDKYIVIWSFSNGTSLVKTKHQKKVFEAVNRAATEWAAANPAKAEELRKRKAAQQK